MVLLLQGFASSWMCLLGFAAERNVVTNTIVTCSKTWCQRVRKRGTNTFAAVASVLFAAKPNVFWNVMSTCSKTWCQRVRKRGTNTFAAVASVLSQRGAKRIPWHVQNFLDTFHGACWCSVFWTRFIQRERGTKHVSSNGNAERNVFSSTYSVSY